MLYYHISIYINLNIKDSTMYNYRLLDVIFGFAQEDKCNYPQYDLIKFLKISFY